MKRTLGSGDGYALTKHKLKQYTLKYISLLVVLTIMCLYARAQQQETFIVTGKVISAADGRAIEGVSITTLPGGHKTISTADGIYIVPAESDKQIQFTHIGYDTLVVFISGRKRLDVKLVPSTDLLQEVYVNAGYYQVKDLERTGSISRLPAARIEESPTTNILNAMQGHLAGVQITQQTGVPGGGFGVRIRGRNSLRHDGNEPLYMVDGVPFPSVPLSNPGGIIPNPNPLNNLNPNDIQSIEILKDGDATAIYGSRGANGVVLITTKKADVGSTVVSLESTAGRGRTTRRLPLLNTAEYLNIRQAAFKNDDAAPGASDYDVNGTWDSTRYTDWQEELLGGSTNLFDVNLRISGGSKYTGITFGAGHHSESTVYPGDFRFRRSAAQLGISHRAFADRLLIDVRANYTTAGNNLPQTDLTRQAATLPPNAPALYNEDGTINWENGTWSNPLLGLKRGYRASTDNLIANGTLSYQISRGLWVKVPIGYNNLAGVEWKTTPRTSFTSYYSGTGKPTGNATKINGKVQSYIIEPQLTYGSTIGRNGISAILGAAVQETRHSGEMIYAYSFTNDAMLESLTAAPNILMLNTNQSQYRYQSLFSRLSYNWNKEVFINLTGRRDASSRFGPEKRVAHFGSIGTAWIFSECRFFRHQLSVLSSGKLRASYGYTGSDQIGDYQYLETYTTTISPYGDVVGLVPNRLTNPDFSWESNRKFDVALETSWFDNSAQLSINWYRNRSSNQLVGYPLPLTTGFASLLMNMPAIVENSGLELEGHYSKRLSSAVRWNTSFNISFPRNELVSYPDIKNSSYAATYEVDKPLDVVIAYRYQGVDSRTGLYQFADINGDGLLTTTNDYVADAVNAQHYYGGWTNGLSIGNVTASFLFQFVKQTGPNYLYYIASPAGTMLNHPREVLNAWEKEGDNASVQRYTQQWGSAAYTQYATFLRSSSAVYGDASYIRLKNVHIAYEIPKRFTGNRFGWTVTAQAHNLLTFSDYVGDPESLNPYILPPLRTLSFGVRLSIR